MPVPQKVEEVVQVPRIAPQGQFMQRPADQIVEVPVPFSVEEFVQAPWTSPLEQVASRKVEQTVDLTVASSRFALSSSSSTSVPQTVEEEVQVPKITQEQIEAITFENYPLKTVRHSILPRRNRPIVQVPSANSYWDGLFAKPIWDRLFIVAM
eukprot:6461170-Amphidinium_carterae.1